MSALHDFFGPHLSRCAATAGRQLRGLASADRDDVLADALLAAWEQREEFDPIKDGSLAQWFELRAKIARQRLRRRGKREGHSDHALLTALLAADDTEQAAEAWETVEDLASELTEPQRAALDLLAAGHSIRTVAKELSLGRSTVRGLSKRLERLQQLTPRRRYGSAPTASRTSDSDMRQQAPIDHKIERMLHRPATERGDCPVCWRCSWFEGLLPAKYEAPRSVDPEIEEAVRATDRRKQQIANTVRATPDKRFPMTDSEAA